MKKNWLKRTIAAVSIACLIGSVEAPQIAFAKQPKEVTAETQTTHGNVSFSDFKYQHYNTKKFYQKIHSIEKLMKNAKNSKKVLTLFNQLYDELQKVYGETEVAQVFNTLDVTNEYYIKESSYCQNLQIEMGDAINALGKKILSSPCAKAAKKEWGKEAADSLLASKTTSKKLINLLNQEQDLISKYYISSVKEYTTKIAGKEYTSSELYYDKNLTDAQKLDGAKDLEIQENNCLGSIYVDLVKVRQQIAKESGYPNYSEYCYKEMYHRDYTTKDSAVFCAQVKEYIAPVFDELAMAMDNHAQDVLDHRISELKGDQLYDLMGPYLPKISKQLKNNFDYMRKYHLYDVDYNDVKSEQGYTQYMTKYNEAFTFNVPGFDFMDLSTAIHEFGHYNEYMVDQNQYDEDNLDLSEIASQGLELLFTHYYPQMLGEKDGKAAVYYTIYDHMDSLVEGCLYDEFQQKVYQMQDPTLDKINQLFTDLAEEYGMFSENKYNYSWMNIGHNFDSPLYYISYATSVAPAFEIWEQSLTDLKGGCKTYTTVVTKGTSGGYVKTLKACGLKNPFEKGYMETLADTVSQYVKKDLK